MTVVAALQMRSGPDVKANLAATGRLLDEAVAAGARLAVLPENFAFMGSDDAARLAVAETGGDHDAPMQGFLRAKARALGLWIVGGTVPIKTTQSGRVLSACLVYDADGNCAARYDKVHLFDVDVPGSAEQYRESASTVAGSEPVVVDTPAGRLGLAVCYDLRFPEYFRALTDRGAQVFVLPAAFTDTTGRAHWEVLLRARAIENQSFVIASAQGGLHSSGRQTFGNTMIVDPWGRVLCRRDAGPGVVTAAIDLRVQRDIRMRFPALEHRVFRVQ